MKSGGASHPLLEKGSSFLEISFFSSLHSNSEIPLFHLSPFSKSNQKKQRKKKKMNKNKKKKIKNKTFEPSFFCSKKKGK